jgi:transposase
MDLVDPRKGVLVGRKSPYPAEFRNDAVALYRAAGGKRTYAAVAADVGVTGETLRSWVRQAGEHAGRGHSHGEQNAESQNEELARLRAENGRLRKRRSGSSSGRSCAGRRPISQRR